jgi:hypothetical protein
VASITEEGVVTAIQDCFLSIPYNA